MPQKMKTPALAKGRRGNNEGSIYQRSSDKRWVGSVTVGYTAEGKAIRKTVYGSSRIEVAKKVSQLTCKVFDIGYTDDTGEVPTFESVANTWLFDYKLGSVKSRSFESYKCSMGHSIRHFGSVPINDVNTAMVQKMLNGLIRKEGLSLRTVKGVRFTLDHFFRHIISLNKGKDNPLVKENPVTDTIINTSERKKKESRTKALTEETRKAVLAAAEQTSLLHKTIITTLMLTGLRSGELTALQWRHIDFDKGTIDVENSVTYESKYDADGKLLSRQSILDVTKTVCSEREIIVPNGVIECLREWMQHQAVEELKRGIELTHKKSFVFPSPSGQMRCYSGISLLVRRFAAKHGLNEDGLKAHALRHTCATILLEKKVNPRVVQEYLGHADVKTTLGTYSDVMREILEGAAGELDSAYSDMMSYNP